MSFFMALYRHIVGSNKLSLIFDWLLIKGLNEKEVSVRRVAREVGVNYRLVQYLFNILALRGVMDAEGISTTKKFFLMKPELLLKNWLENYNFVQRCTMKGYISGFQEKAELLEVLKESKLDQKVVLALHSAAEAYGCKNTNLNTLELYQLDPLIRPQLEEKLLLKPWKYRMSNIEPYYKSLLRLGYSLPSYDVLLIKPYHKNLLTKAYCSSASKGINISSPLLTFLDLYHFPLYGLEQAEFMAERIPELKRIYKTEVPYKLF